MWYQNLRIGAIPEPDGSPVSIDILGALAESPQPSGGKCKLQRLLDSVDPDTPGLDDLVAIVNTQRPKHGPLPTAYRPLTQTRSLLKKLGLGVGMTCLHEHRTRVCECYV